MKQQLPTDHSMDSTLALKRDPYGFIRKRCRQLGSDVFQTRLLGRKTICMSGEAAARLFYDSSRFVRHGAAPVRLQKTLLGVGGIQTLDGETHRHRRALFLSVLSDDRVGRLVELAREELLQAVNAWTQMDQVVLYRELQLVFTRAVCEWAGVPVTAHEILSRTQQLTALFDYAGAVGPWPWRSRLARRQSQRWMCDVIRSVRAGELQPMTTSALSQVALYADERGRQLPVRLAAVELLNVLRPVVAVSVYGVFVAHALHAHPHWRQRLQTQATYERAFVQEVRRLYPFFPAVPARVRSDFQWQGCRFAAGTRAMLDLHGTNHDPRTWDAPDEFRPERFDSRTDGMYKFIPQGGGDPATGHRCPGEPATIALMQMLLGVFVREIAYTVPPQTMDIDVTRLPAMLPSRLLIRDVQRRAPEA